MILRRGDSEEKSRELESRKNNPVQFSKDEPVTSGM